MLRNSSETFISQSISRKFLDTLEDLLTSSRTIPVVRERVMNIVAAAAYASGSKKDVGFRGLWRRVKPEDKPEEGMPFDTKDAMFNPPLPGSRQPAYDYDTNSANAPVVYHDATSIVPDAPPPAGTIPVVPERVMEVLAAATYASGSNKAWDKPEEGEPFATEDDSDMFYPGPRVTGDRLTDSEEDSEGEENLDELRLMHMDPAERTRQRMRDGHMEWKFLYRYTPSLQNADELEITAGEVVRVLFECSDGWALCMNARGEQGQVPLLYLELHAKVVDV
ncbi:hypothetical protein C8R44DRAFT_4590 [Mycena epipterygia]|nr:hypothetical protein C8R44DRAFT_4590 [Mycena epipterygia]